MASKYLDLYTGAGGYYGGFGGNQLMAKPTIGVQQGTYRNGQTTRVVHDTLNNKYYGTQTQDQLIKGLQDSIARNQAAVKNPWGTNVINAGTIFQQEQRYKKSAQEIADMNTAIKNQQNYLNQINSGMYKQESSTFFDSYDDWTGDWNNLFKRRYDNTQTKENNRLQEIENAKILKQNERNQRITDRSKRENTDIYQGDATKSKAKALGISPNTDINTGMSTEATKLSDALLKDNGLSI